MNTHYQISSLIRIRFYSFCNIQWVMLVFLRECCKPISDWYSFNGIAIQNGIMITLTKNIIAKIIQDSTLFSSFIEQRNWFILPITWFWNYLPIMLISFSTFEIGREIPCVHPFGIIKEIILNDLKGTNQL